MAVVRGDPREEIIGPPEGMELASMEAIHETHRIGAAQYLLKEGYIKSVENLGEGKYSLTASEKVKLVKVEMDELDRNGD